MTHRIDIEAVLAPFPGDNPSGEDLRSDYKVYDSIKEARRADDLLARGDWQRDLKTSDWEAVVALSTHALTEKSKDLQIAVWLTEGLIHAGGFPGLLVGLQVLNGLLERFWDTVYPFDKDGDIGFRAGPFQFLNEKVWVAINGIPLTDPGQTPGYGLRAWQEARKVGYEETTTDERRRAERKQLIAEGKISADEFDLAVAKTTKDFYRELSQVTSRCLEECNRLEESVDEKLGKEAPSLINFKTAIEDCHGVVTKLFKKKLTEEPDDEAEASEKSAPLPDEEEEETETAIPEEHNQTMPATDINPTSVDFSSQGEGKEGILWEEANRILKNGNLKAALEKLFLTSCTSSSVREKNRYRLLMAKLCLKAERADLARPILDELYSLIDEFHLDRWESPVWVAEVIEALYQCLTSQRYAEEDPGRVKGLLTRLCSMDVTKAMIYRN